MPELTCRKAAVLIHATRTAITLTGFLCLLPTLSAAPEPTISAADLDWFEKKVRPLLTENCYECHSAGKQKGGLRLDSRIGWSRGGDSGPALIAGDVENSPLIQAVRYQNPDLAMPPKSRLSAQQVATLEEWIKRGAPDPRRSETPSAHAAPAIDWSAAKSHWAYKPVTQPAPPKVRQTDWPQNAIDTFILARLEAEKITPAPDADRTQLIRRLSFDLWGLPPTPQQIDAFLADQRPDAWPRLVDELLASPRFGERWGRHWLDVARYAESVNLRGFIYKEAWRYRDYVVHAFNTDLPYDQFVLHQIAGDLMPADNLDQKHRQMAAATFLVLGNTNFEEQDKKQLEMDLIDEQLDTLGKAFMAQTIGCARCHDHKFDPIPTADYYAMAGILRSTTALEHSNVSKWIELPLPLPADQQSLFDEQDRAVADLQGRIKSDKQKLTKLTEAASKATVDMPAIIPVSALDGEVVDSTQAKAVGDWKNSQYSKSYIGDGYLHDQDAGKGSKTLTFHPELPKAGRYEVRLAYVVGGNRADKVPVTILHADGETLVHVNQQQNPPIDSRFVSLGTFRFEQGNQGYVLIANENTQGHVIADAVQWLSQDETPRPVAAAAGKNPPDADIQALQKQVQQLEKDLKQLQEKALARPMVMGVRETGPFKNLPIHVRGNVHVLGAPVPRGFLRSVNLKHTPTIPSDQSGRLQLAEWMTDPAHPLTSRVMVNRIWTWMFGEGLVRSTDNFGTTGNAPSHPELLDALADRFVRNGWSVKSMVREMALSHTYRMACRPAAATDPENHLLGRANRQRLEAEPLRDAMLAISGELKLESGGQTWKPGTSADYGYKHTEPVRSVYVPLFRNALPEIFEVFDYPDPSLVSGRRNISTVAPQALFMMNHRFVMEQAAITAKHLLAEPLDTPARVDRAYRLILGRLPQSQERAVAEKYLNAAAPGNAADLSTRWTRLVQSLFASPDFRYVE